MMKGSVNEDGFLMVHDPLVLMAAKTTITWMRRNKYLHRWLLTFNGLQGGMSYVRRPVCNIPKFVPLYNSLNRDILYSFCFIVS